MKIIKGLFILVLISGCKSTPEDDGSMQNYDGYPLIENQEEIKQILKDKCLDTISFRAGEVIADIGAGNGYLEGMLSVYNDSLTFYIQDNDTTICNPEQVGKVVEFYEGVRGRPITNTFTVVIGTDSTTNLPDDSFDKILMLWTYPYIKNHDKFITDVRENLNDQGLFYVIDPGFDYYGEYELALKYGWNTSPIEKVISDIIDCGFELVRISRNYDDGVGTYIMVFRKASS